MESKNIIPFTGCFTAIWNILDGTVHVVLVKRKDKPVWELPGGGLDPEDVAKDEDPFENCAIREVVQESGIKLFQFNLTHEAELVQRVPIGNHSIGIGTVHLYSHKHPQLDGESVNHNFLQNLKLFTGDETQEVSFTPIVKSFFRSKDVSDATKRMIALLLSRVHLQLRPKIIHSALSFPVYIPKFDLTV